MTVLERRAYICNHGLERTGLCVETSEDSDDGIDIHGRVIKIVVMVATEVLLVIV